MRSIRRLLLVGVLLTISSSAVAQRVISGNENKIDLSQGGQDVVRDAEPDSLSFLDFATFPPKVEHVTGISNTVIGPPSNIAITPDGRLALVADSLRINPENSNETVPSDRVHVVDLTSRPPKVTGQVAVGSQPSGMSITRDGRLALVANRADGTVSVLAIDGQTVRLQQSVTVCAVDEEASDVAITPDGRRALVSINKAGYLRLLEIDGSRVTATDRQLSVFGKPYRCVITPDGRLGLTAGSGLGQPPDADAISVIDLQTDPVRTIDYVALGSGPESIEISPGGELLAAVLMNGSNLPADDPQRTENGLLVILARRGRTFERTQQIEIGRIPEGVAFTSDGRHLVVQCHPARELWIFKVEQDRVSDTGRRISVPGFPSSLRAAP